MSKEVISRVGGIIKNTLQPDKFQDMLGIPGVTQAISEPFKLPGFGRRGLTSQFDIQIETLDKDFIFDPQNIDEPRVTIVTRLINPTDPDNSIAYRSYSFSVDRPGHVVVTSDMRVYGSYQGHQIGEALVMTSDIAIDYIINHTPALEEMHIDAIIFDRAEGDEPKEEGGSLPERASWTSSMAIKMGYEEEPSFQGEPRTFKKTFR